MNAVEKESRILTYDVLDLCVERMKVIPGKEFPVIVHTMEDKEDGSISGRLSLGGQSINYITLPPHVTMREIINRHKTSPLDPNGPVFLVRHLDVASRLKLKEEEVNYVDVAGNCFLTLPSVRAVINIRDTNPVKPPYSGKAFQKKGLILVFHFLAFPSFSEVSYRTMNEQTGVSTGAISAIMEDLRAQGFLIDQQGKPTLQNVRELIRRWSYAYLEVLRPSLHRGFLHSRKDNLIGAAQTMGINDRLFLGGQYAVMMLGDYLSSKQTVIYTNLRLAELSQKYDMRPVGKQRSEADVELLSTFWNTGIIVKDPFKKLFTVDFLTYADLLLDHDSRVLEAAAKFLNDEIRNRFQNAGLQW